MTKTMTTRTTMRKKKKTQGVHIAQWQLKLNTMNGVDWVKLLVRARQCIEDSRKFCHSEVTYYCNLNCVLLVSAFACARTLMDFITCSQCIPFVDGSIAALNGHSLPNKYSMGRATSYIQVNHVHFYRLGKVSDPVRISGDLQTLSLYLSRTHFT